MLIPSYECIFQIQAHFLLIKSVVNVEFIFLASLLQNIMVTKFMIVAAVPFCTARLQAGLTRNIAQMVSGAEKCVINADNSANLNRTRRKRSRNVSLKEKIQLRRERNKAAAHISRERAKIQQNLLEQRISELKYEKMKLLLENEALKSKNTELKEENGNLKFLAQDFQSEIIEEGNSKETTVKHAWFVNIPLLKEWVVPRILFIVMIAIWESLKLNTSILHLSTPHYRIQQNFNSLKSLMLPTCLPWKSMIPQAACLQNFIILNG